MSVSALATGFDPRPERPAALNAAPRSGASLGSLSAPPSAAPSSPKPKAARPSQSDAAPALDLAAVAAEISEISPVAVVGSVRALQDASFRVGGLAGLAKIGDGVRIDTASGRAVLGEIVGLEPDHAIAMAFAPLDGAAVGDPVRLTPQQDPRPSLAWLGRALDAYGRPITGDGAVTPGKPTPLRARPPRALERRGLGPRLSTGHAPLDTFLPICQGQRVGVFAGSGVGKSRLLAALAERMAADVVVSGLIGERGREAREFVETTLGPEAMARAVVIVATSDQPAAVKRRAAWLTMAVAERFRDDGAHVLLLFDSLTRFANAHREVALMGGEPATFGGFPPSTSDVIAGLAERAGPGEAGTGDITAIFTVLVAGSNMDEPVADMTRGILDGHIVLSREIAERGRFPAIDVRRSVSRSLPEAATADENALLTRARKVLATYEQAEPMIQIGLYKAGSDPEIDEAIRLWPALDGFVSKSTETPGAAFDRLRKIFGVI